MVVFPRKKKELLELEVIGLWISLQEKSLKKTVAVIFENILGGGNE